MDEQKAKLKMYKSKLSFSLITPNLIVSIILVYNLPRNLSWMAGINLVIGYIIYFILVSKQKKKLNIS